MVRKTSFLKMKILLRDNKLALGFLFVWFAFGFLVYFFAYRMPFQDALRASLFFERVENDFSAAYDIWTQGIVFGVIFTVLFQNVLDRHYPERSCRMLAKEMREHVVVVGYSHLGNRLVSFFREHRIPYCLIEKNADNVDDLLREGEPVVVDDARESDALVDANVREARAVLIVSNNLETALLVTKRVRDENAQCPIIARCYQDEFVEILETLGANDVISSSKNAFDDIVARLCMKP